MTRPLVVLGSVKGGPGVTTLALALATRWNVAAAPTEPVVLLEADAYGGDIAAWRKISDTPGLLAVAGSVRHGAADPIAVGAQDLAPGVRVVPAPAKGAFARAALALLNDGGLAWVRGTPAAPAAGVVLADAGRLGEPGLATAAAADMLLLVSRGGVDSLAHIAAELDDLQQLPGWLGLIVVGRCPYGMAEIARTFGLGWVHHLPWDADTADVLQRGGPVRRRTPALVRAVDDLVRDVRRNLAISATVAAASSAGVRP